MQLGFFRLPDSEERYKIEINRAGGYEMFLMTVDSWELVGGVTLTPYSFIISKRVQGIVLRKEIAFNEVR